QLLEALLPQYIALVQKLISAGATIIQFDEPILATGRFDTDQSPLTGTYEAIAAAAGTAETWVVVPYGDPGATWDALVNLPVSGIGLDLTRDLTVDDIVRRGFPAAKVLIAGIVDGRNIWTNDLDASLSQLETLSGIVGPDQIVVSTSCSLLHVPYDVALEPDLDPATQSWFAFARQKVDEVVTLTRGLATGRNSIAQEIATSTAIRGEMKKSPQRNVASVRSRVRTIDSTADQRSVPFAQRRTIQADTLKLPDLPTTTIGSFPQTPALRSARRKFDKGEIDLATYDAAIEESIRETIAEQEAIGLDVLVHGEPERNDMVQYFGEQLEGFVFTHNGWVQSYGSRMVRPPIILGDVSRPHPMTVRWATFAQSLSERPVKGMLTGPVTILNWSFVRDDQPRAETCRQIALAIRDEVADLESAGIRIIQIDEPALREGLPLRRQNWAAYLDWATRCFRISAGIARLETQIHTHMCYSAFGDVIGAISDLDADVLSIENARSDLEMLRVFSEFGYDKGVGPGVYDIHSPRVPSTEEMVANLDQTLTLLNRDQIWVNPDCGLKTRNWEEARQALINMVAAAQLLRSRVPVA
ncbi:MAG TPA: 5-methyltetrahydropteroyltriglutamate--homocysteine S-methyltransferase, partial [Thermomicrobiales bacterium]|nr:5-methyltetrahydropteroyltriglutamate--homocysteine S-methyltransferase [Thermomicrobiales bacterium]